MTRGTLHYGAGNVAKVWVDIHDGEVRASSGRPKATLPFNNLADKYRSDVLPLLKPASQASIDSVLSKLCETFGSKKLHAIGTDDIQSFITGSAYAPKTIKNHVGVMKMVWHKARAWDYVRHDPFEFLSMPRAPLTEARTLSVDDVRAIIRKTDEPFKTMLWVLAETGLRGGELCGLYHSDITNGVIKIARSVFRKQIQTPKTASAFRMVAISGRLARHLEEYATTSNATRHIGNSGGNSGNQCVFAENDRIASDNRATDGASPRGGRTEVNLLFSMPDGRPWDNGEIVRRLKPVLGAGVGLHAFRHFSASLMAILGVPEHIRRERLGHSGGGITARYTHSSPEDHRRWAEAIGREICTENVFSRAAGMD